MHKKWIRREVDNNKVKDLQEQLKINPQFCELLIDRGIETYDDAKEFFRPDIKKLHDPFLMKDMDKAINRIEYALKRQESIMIYGDYDVDGTTSVAVVYSFFKDYFENIEFYIPDRYAEGYGVSNQAIDYAADKGISLIISLDCGVTNIEQIEYSNLKNIDFIVCDHHLPGDELPKAYAILDAKQKDCPYPFKELSGCGVGFKLLQGFCDRRNLGYEKLFSFLDLVSISIGCDIVPIIGENRILAFHGLKLMNEKPRLGIESIYELVGIKEVDKETGEVWINEVGIEEIVFRVGPKINAAGRISDAKDAVRMMVAENKEEAESYAKLITEHNESRQEMDKDITEAAIERVYSSPELQAKKSIVLHDKEWHKGVIGIVASRMVEEFYKPTIMLGFSDGMYTGSARSVKGYDIHAALKSCSDLLEKFGGHMYAAGLSVKPENLEAFIERFEYTVNATIQKDQLTPEIMIDLEIGLHNIEDKFFKILKQFAPFGPGNDKPVFLSKSVEDSGRSRLVGENHIKVSLLDRQNRRNIEGIAFNQKQYFKPMCNQKYFDVCYTLGVNAWRGNKSIQMDVKDFKFN